MVVTRPATLDDIERIVELAAMAGFGLTSLPKDPDLLDTRVRSSVENFSAVIERPGGELYIFVMEDLESGKVIGTSCIVSKVGGMQPFYAYRIETCVHESQMLNVRKEIQILHLSVAHEGPSEIGGLYLAPSNRKHGNGRLLSLFRFLFMAEFPQRFESDVIAEMRGVVDEHGVSPFWDALGRHFFDIDYPKADYLSIKDKRFIADLMPTCPIYVPLLPEPAREVIGKVHEHTRPALEMLLAEGFRVTGMVDIFEAGPIIKCPLKDVRVVRESSVRTVVDVQAHDHLVAGRFLITNARSDFRACVGPVELLPEGGVRLSRETAQALQVTVRDRVRIAPLHPGETRKDDR
jgi:arginine N-succinyltransferase